MDDEQLGGMSANLKNLCVKVDKLDEKINKFLEVNEVRLDQIDARINKQKGFLAGILFLFPSLSALVAYLNKKFGG